MLDDQKTDVIYERIRLVSQFLLSLFVLSGVGIIILTPGTPQEADSGGAAIATLIITYWFGRGFGLSK